MKKLPVHRSISLLKTPYEFTYPPKSLTEYLNAPPTNAVYTNKIFEKYDPVTDIETYEENGFLYDEYGTWTPDSCTINGVFSYNVKMEYPVFSGIKNKAVENTLNQMISDFIKKQQEQIKKGDLYYQIDYAVYCLNSKFVSIMFSIQTEGVGLNFQWYGHSSLSRKSADIYHKWYYAQGTPLTVSRKTNSLS